MPAIGALPVRKVTYQASLTQYTNGKIPLEVLTVIGPRGWLYGNAARAYKALAFMCMSIGLPLTYTYGGTFRSYADQLNLWYQRMQTEPCVWGRKADGSPIVKTKMWNGVTWYLKPGLAGCATPGGSNHGWAIAIDTAFDPYPFDADGISPADAEAITNHPQWPKFKEFAQACGFSWEDTSEPWHIRYCLGDEVSQLILDVEAMIAGPAPQPAPAPTPVPAPSPSPVPAPAPVTDPSEEDDVFKQVIMVKGNPQTAALCVIGGPVPHLTGTGAGTLSLAAALKGCGQTAPEPVEKFYYVDLLTKYLNGAGYPADVVANFVAGVPDEK